MKFLFLLLTCMSVGCTRQDTSSLKIRILERLEKIDSETADTGRMEQYLDSIHKELGQYKNDSITRNLLFKTSWYYYKYENYKKYLDLSKELYELSLSEQDTAHIAKSLYYIGDYYDSESKIDSALHYYTQSSKYYKLINDTLNIGRTTLYKAGMLYDGGNYTESEIEAINALQFLVDKANNRLIYECYNLIALSLEEQNDLDKALQYFNLALEQLKKLEFEDYPIDKIFNSRASCFNNIGRVYEKKGDYEKAISIYYKGMQTKDLKSNKPQLYAMLLNNLAYSKMKSNDLKNVKNLLFESLHIRDSLNIIAGTVSSKIRIGEYYLYTKDTASAIKYFKDGYILSKQIKSHHDILNSLKLLAENDQFNRDHHAKLYITVSDSLRNVERAAKNKFARIAYETDEIEAKNHLLSKQNTIIVVIFGIGTIIFISIFIMYRLRTKNKELIHTHEQQLAKEEIYKLMLEQQSKTKDAREEERSKLAMALHDGVINKIFTTRFNLMQLETTQTDKKKQLVTELEVTQEEIRRVSHELKQNFLLEDKSFPELIESHIASQQTATDIVLDLYIDKYINWQAVITENKIHLYRIVQELVYNAIKHSYGTTCNIAFFKNADAIVIRIWDDGVGFDTNKLSKGIGFKNINERVKALHGTMDIKSTSGSGTHIEILV